MMRLPSPTTKRRRTPRANMERLAPSSVASAKMVAQGTWDRSVMTWLAGDSTVTLGGLKAPIKKQPWEDIWACASGRKVVVSLMFCLQ